VFADKPSKKKDFRCTLGNTQTLTSSDGTPPVASATCGLKAGWLIVATASKADPKPESQWSVTAQYNGSNAYEGSSGTKHGTATS
jgi:hypothetical protein